jgi:hypothetical protein
MEIIMDSSEDDNRLYEIEKKILFIDNKIEAINDKIETIYQNTILINKNILDTAKKDNIILNNLSHYMLYIINLFKTFLNL